jgi:fatty acid synthase subunit alpha
LLPFFSFCASKRTGAVCRTSNNNDAVNVTGRVLRDGELVIEIRPSFLYRGRFSDYQNTFEIVEEPD